MHVIILHYEYYYDVQKHAAALRTWFFGKFASGMQCLSSTPRSPRDWITLMFSSQEPSRLLHHRPLSVFPALSGGLVQEYDAERSDKVHHHEPIYRKGTIDKEQRTPKKGAIMLPGEQQRATTITKCSELNIW